VQLAAREAFEQHDHRMHVRIEARDRRRAHQCAQPGRRHANESPTERELEPIPEAIHANSLTKIERKKATRSIRKRRSPFTRRRKILGAAMRRSRSPARRLEGRIAKTNRWAPRESPPDHSKR
jgi:hypothetical protein